MFWKIAFLCAFLCLNGCARAGGTTSEGFVEGMSIHSSCLPNMSAVTKQVTHYYVPLLEKYDHYSCHQMEGTCIHKKEGEDWLYNYGYGDQKLKWARCKNGYGNQSNCLNPCRTVAASTSHHRFGEIIYIPALVGKKCGNARDFTEMTHDGFVMVADTGSPTHFNAKGRFDFFWGRCKDKADGVCKEGALPLSQAASNSPYCMVWNPADPNKNAKVRADFIGKVKMEASLRNDPGAADELY